MKILRLTIYVLLLSGTLCAATQWTDTKTHAIDWNDQTPAKVGLSSVQIHKLKQTLRLSGCDDFHTAERNFSELRVEKIDLGAQEGYAVQAGDGCSCGAPGNCTLWILDAQMNILLKYEAQTFAVLPTSTNGQHDIVLTEHNSAFESYWSLYHFTGQYYRRIQCADVNYAPTPDATLEKPLVTSISCSKM